MDPVKKRTPWSYLAGTTPLHRCSAGIKLFLLLFLSASPVLGLSVMAGAAVLILAGAFSTGLGPRPLLAGSAPLVIILLVFAVFRAASIDDGQSGIDITRFTLDQSVLLSGLQMAAGILLCFTAGSLFFAVTTTMEIRNFLSRLELFLLRPFYKSKPQSQGRLSLSLALMLGFLPRFFECWENASLAARARGCTGGLRRVKTILPLVTEKMIETAAETAEALESRGLKL